MTIIFEDITKSYNGQMVLDHFNAEIEDKRCYVFVGPEGSGKTTALKIFMGLEKPDEGELHRMGDYKYPTLQSSYVSQEGRLNEKKTAIWNVKKAHRRVSKNRAIEELLRFLPEDKLKLPVAELSVTEQKLVELVAALFIPSDFIVLDEPFYGMEKDLQKKVLDYLLDVKGSRPLIIAQRTNEGLEKFKKVDFSKEG
ncbi:MAG: ATP-binding cassette domain-containing protein [Lachnospiraceae bacterium]|nr:ATP-binding cassette domain-containing protein [Lachnospiraceae bacterium]